MWASFNRLELQITKAQAAIGSHQGDCEEDVKYLRTFPALYRQLNKLDPQTVREELAEYGAWDETELSDHDENLTRLLWLACGNILDEIN